MAEVASAPTGGVDVVGHHGEVIQGVDLPTKDPVINLTQTGGGSLRGTKLCLLLPRRHIRSLRPRPPSTRTTLKDTHQPRAHTHQHQHHHHHHTHTHTHTHTLPHLRPHILVPIHTHTEMQIHAHIQTRVRQHQYQ